MTHIFWQHFWRWNGKKTKGSFLHRFARTTTYGLYSVKYQWNFFNSWLKFVLAITTGNKKTTNGLPETYRYDISMIIVFQALFDPEKRFLTYRQIILGLSVYQFYFLEVLKLVIITWHNFFLPREKIDFILSPYHKSFSLPKHEDLYRSMFFNRITRDNQFPENGKNPPVEYMIHWSLTSATIGL